ncbi:hypothetical protein V2G26_001928 [Clonostachys chloroleuca]
MESSVLIQDVHNFLTLNVLSMMTSLELVWSLEDFTVEEAFPRHAATVPSDEPSIECPSVIFPALQHLRIAFKPVIRSQKAFGIQLRHNYNAQQRQKESETIHEYFLPKLDCVLARITPPTTEIIISWSNWGPYSLFDLKLFEVQGKDKTRMHQPDIGGMACLRELPSPMSYSAPETVDHEQVARNGYWLHVAEPNLEHALDGYDRKRHELYGLGSTKLRLYSRSNGQVTDPDLD